jgi:hypothetical protein
MVEREFIVSANLPPKTRMSIGDFGERGRNRTFNLLIKSQLLCQLSYAPTVGNSQVGQTKIIAFLLSSLTRLALPMCAAS